MGLIGFVGLMGLCGCDKIEEGEYTVYDGAAVTWTSGTLTETPVQRVFVEKFTGPKCSNCPLADETLATINDERVVIVSINHPTGQGLPFPGEPDMRTEGGNKWDAWYGINAIPSAFINREKSVRYQGSMTNIVSAINQALNKPLILALDVHAENELTDVHVTVNLKFIQRYTKPITLTAALIEDSLAYKQLLPDGNIDEQYMHNHMLRKVITGFWGSEIDCTGNADESRQGTFDFNVGEGINLENSHIVVFVSDKASRSVINCASCRVRNDE